MASPGICQARGMIACDLFLPQSGLRHRATQTPSLTLRVLFCAIIRYVSGMSEPANDLQASVPQEYKVQLEQYSGPLELLLYLIRRDEVDVKNIPIARITEQ